jgi:hypothetical protein
MSNEDFLELSGLFDSYGLPPVVSDSLSVLDKFSASGFKTHSVSEICSMSTAIPKHAILIPAAPSRHPNTELHRRLKNSAILLIPLLAFSHDERAVDYIITRLRLLDFSDACQRNRRTIEFIQHFERKINVYSPGCHLSVELGNNVDVFAPKLEPNIVAGEWISIIQFLEIGLVPNQDCSSFDVNGTLSCGGVSIAHHLHSHFESGPAAQEAWILVRDLMESGRFPLTLEVEKSQMKSIRTSDGVNILEKIKPLTDQVLRGNLTEVGFGSLSPSDDIDWCVNSQLNEPVGALHLALGAGEDAAHIDFVSPDSRIAEMEGWQEP